jgi:hypothetical protein
MPESQREESFGRLLRAVVIEEMGRARRLGVRLLAGLRRAADWFPWTPLGLLLTAAAYAAIHEIALAQLDLVWLVIGYGGLGLCALCPAAVLLAATYVKLRGPLAAPTDALLLETGTARDSGFRLRAPFYLPLVQLRWHWLAPVGAELELLAEGTSLRERARLPERGRFTRIERRVVVSDPFGLCRIALRMRQERALDVLPRLQGLRLLPSLRALASGDAVPHPMGLEDGDRIELRRYMPGDPARFIHWKVFSRTRRLMVRTPERALAVARRTAAFLIAGADDDASAAVARLALERRLLGSEFRFGTDLAPGGTDRVDEALAQLMESGSELARARAGQGLAAFVQTCERSGPVSLVVFTPSQPGPWLDAVTAIARRRKLQVVIGTDGVRESTRAPLWRRLLAMPAPQPGTDLSQLEETVRALAVAGAAVSVIDRPSGRELGETERRAMRALGAKDLAA